MIDYRPPGFKTELKFNADDPRYRLSENLLYVIDPLGKIETVLDEDRVGVVIETTTTTTTTPLEVIIESSDTIDDGDTQTLATYTPTLDGDYSIQIYIVWSGTSETDTVDWVIKSHGGSTTEDSGSANIGSEATTPPTTEGISFVDGDGAFSVLITPQLNSPVSYDSTVTITKTS